MNRSEYMAALRTALSVLPEEERANALRYYEEYFDDAGPENEQKSINDLGSPQKIAEQILADYRELTAVPNRQAKPSPSARRSISPWLLLVIVLLAIPLGIPLLTAAAGVLIAILTVLVSIGILIALALIGIPLVLLLGGGALLVFSCFLWLTPANALVTLGVGLAALALGVLAALLSVKLCVLFVPPIFRGFVAILRWPFDKLFGRKKGGASA